VHELYTLLIHLMSTVKSVGNVYSFHKLIDMIMYRKDKIYDL